MRKFYLLASLVALSALAAPAAFSTSPKPTGIDVVVQKAPGTTSVRQVATPNKDGSFSVELPRPGKYTINYADGPKKGAVIKTVTVAKAGPVGINVPVSLAVATAKPKPAATPKKAWISDGPRQTGSHLR